MSLAEDKIQNISYWKERVDLAAAFRWAARFDAKCHGMPTCEAVSNVSRKSECRPRIVEK